ncbi:MAG: RNA polymerase sigma factor [Puniceicoccaceae bacterium]
MEAAIKRNQERITFTSGEDFPRSFLMGNGAPVVDLEKAVRDHYKDIYRFAMHLCRNQDDAADLTQFAYEQLTLKHREIRNPEKVKSWLNAVVYRKFIDQRRKVIRFPSVPIDEESAGSDAATTNLSGKLDAKAALAALHELEDDLRAPLSLFYLESIPYKEIARILDLPVGTVMSRLYRGKAKLYNRLTGNTK